MQAGVMGDRTREQRLLGDFQTKENTRLYRYETLKNQFLCTYVNITIFLEMLKPGYK